METITFTKVKLPYGWMSNMSPFAVVYQDKQWRTTEALFQALRFDDESIQELIREQTSPMTAKMKAKAIVEKMIIPMGGKEDLDNMRLCLKLKIEQHPQLKQELIDSKDSLIIEDCTNRRASIWGAQLIDDKWVGDNLLGKLWMELREQLKCPSYQQT